MTSDRPLRIVRLEAANVKRLRAVAIEPDGNLIVVGGRNGQGKTSLLDSIMFALGGQGTVCERPLRDGTQKGHVEVDLGDLVVRRTFTPGGGALTVMGADGSLLKSPQAILDKLVGRLAFDPLAFSKMEPRQQLDTLRELVGIDFTDLDAQRADIYAERTVIGRQRRQEEALVVATPFDNDAPREDVSIVALLDELAAIDVVNSQVVTLESGADEMERIAISADDAHRSVAREIEALAQRLGELDRQLHLTRLDADHKSGEAIALRTRAQAERAAVPDPGPIRARIAEAEAMNERRRLNAERAAVRSKASALATRFDDLTAVIESIDAQKAALIEAATFPVDGLAFGEKGVLMAGVPFEQASAAEQVRVSVAMGLAMHPKLNVLLIRDGSLLDMDSLAMVAQMAADADAQVWMERVGDGEECSLVIEDGTVVGASKVEA